MNRELSKDNEQVLTRDEIERMAFENFVERIEQATKDYINDDTASDCIRRADRASGIFTAMLEQVGKCAKGAISLN